MIAHPQDTAGTLGHDLRRLTVTRGHLEGRVAVITGGGRGIGRAAAETFARLGAAVVIADLGTELDGSGRDTSLANSVADQIVSSGHRAVGLMADVADPEDAARIVETAIDTFGRLDVVVNAAGIIRPGTIATMSDHDWDATLRVHLAGTMRVTRAAVDHWSRVPGVDRRLINFASDSGLYGEQDFLAYGVAKAGVVALTLGVAPAVESVGGTANVFIPQAATRMTASIPVEDLPDSDRWKTGEFDPVHVTPMLVYLASQASGWLNGEIVGGWGHEAHRYMAARRARSMYSDGPWDLDELFARVRAELGDGASEG